MKITRTNFANLLAVSLAAMVLSGCLSKVEPVTNPVGDVPDTTQDRPPVISGDPPNAVTIGSSYAFTPNANDPDGDPLAFSISNMPAWASFDGATGTLSGTPTLANIGIYSNIVIMVSAGSLNSSLSPFPVEVVQTALGSVLLSWTPPTQYDDGATLNDLAAYKFYYGTTSGQYSNSVRVDEPGIASYVIENLVPDTYYFVATAISARGVESRYSNEAVGQVL